MLATCRVYRAFLLIAVLFVHLPTNERAGLALAGLSFTCGEPVTVFQRREFDVGSIHTSIRPRVSRIVIAMSRRLASVPAVFASRRMPMGTVAGEPSRTTSIASAPLRISACPPSNSTLRSA